MDFAYRFAAVRGLQANRAYYTAMVPLRMLAKLFPEDEEYVSPEHRAQRKINQSRIPSIRKYILDNRDNYVFSALAASIDGEFNFLPSDLDANIGTLEVSMDAKFLINDGQHRKAAILEAIQEDDTLLGETISVVFYEDQGLARSQQMFTDLNKHAVKTSNSIAELYDSRDQLAVITRSVITRIDFLNCYTDKEKDILGKYSSKLFTLSTFYNANKRILRAENITEKTESYLYEYWSAVCRNVQPWQDLINHEISKVDLREQFIVTQSVVIQVFGRLGNSLLRNNKRVLEKTLKPLSKIDWRRESALWKGRTIRANGRVINNEEAIMLTCNVLKQALGLPLDSAEASKEASFAKEDTQNVR